MLFEDYAIDLIEEMQTQIHSNSSANYERGIAGIGVGMDYLFKNNLLEADDGIFDDFDKRMYRAVMYDPWQNFSLYEGLTGYGRYWMFRLPVAKQASECLLRIVEYIEEKTIIISDKEQIDVFCFLQDLKKKSSFSKKIKLLEKCQIPADNSYSFPRFENSPIGNIMQMYQHFRYINSDIQGSIYTELNKIMNTEIGKFPVSMGLLNGNAGEGMMRLTALTPMNITWIDLM